MLNIEFLSIQQMLIICNKNKFSNVSISSYTMHSKLTVVHLMNLNCSKLIVNLLTVFVHLGIKKLDVF